MSRQGKVGGQLGQEILWQMGKDNNLAAWTERDMHVHLSSWDPRMPCSASLHA